MMMVAVIITATRRYGRTSLLRRYVELMSFARITTDPGRMAGTPCIRDLRFPVGSVVAMVADGMTFAEIMTEHPDLEEEDIRQALQYAAVALRDRGLPLRTGT